MSHTDEAVLEKLRTLSDAATQGEWETVHVATGRGVDWVVTKGLKPLLRVHRLPQRNADEEASNGRLAAAAVNYVRSLIATAPAADARIARLEEEIEQLKIGLQVAEKLYRETLGIKGGGGG